MKSFFHRENEPSAAAPAADPSRSKPPAPRAEKTADRQKTHLAHGSKVVGEISGTAELVIDGEVEGQIELENRVVVGGKGRVDGRIVATTVEVGGQVHGNVRGLQRVEILPSGRLEGDIVSPRVVIAEGAFFKGNVEMVDEAAKKRSAAKPSTKKPPVEKPPKGTASSPPAEPPQPKAAAGKGPKDDTGKAKA